MVDYIYKKSEFFYFSENSKVKTFEVSEKTKNCIRFLKNSLKKLKLF